MIIYRWLVKRRRHKTYIWRACRNKLAVFQPVACIAGLSSSVATSCRLLYSERFFKSKMGYGKRGEWSHFLSGKASWDETIAWHMGIIARGGQQPTMDGMSMVSSHPRWSFTVCTFPPLPFIIFSAVPLPWLRDMEDAGRKWCVPMFGLRLGSHIRKLAVIRGF